MLAGNHASVENDGQAALVTAVDHRVDKLLTNQVHLVVPLELLVLMERLRRLASCQRQERRSLQQDRTRLAVVGICKLLISPGEKFKIPKLEGLVVMRYRRLVRTRCRKPSLLVFFVVFFRGGKRFFVIFDSCVSFLARGGCFATARAAAAPSTTFRLRRFLSRSCRN